MTKSKVTDEQKNEILNDYYYTKSFQFGIKKLYELLRLEQPDAKISYRYTRDWLSKQVPYQTNQLQRQSVHIKPIQTKRKLALIQIDLIDYSQNASPNAYKYLLNIVDVWSRKCWLIKLKNKKAVTLKEDMEKWLDENKDEANPYRVVQSDDGGEFKSLEPVFKKYNIKHSISSIPQANGIVERTNQTIRRLLSKIIIQKNASSRWPLIGLVERNYNNTYHSSIKMTPNERFKITSLKKINKLNDQEAKQSAEIVAKRQPIINSSIEIEPGDWVRIKKKKKGALDKTKGFSNYSVDIYTVSRIIRAIKAGMNQRYELKNQEGSIMKKRFYRDDLLKISKDTNTSMETLGSDDMPEDTKDYTEEEVLFEVKNEPSASATEEETKPKVKPKRQPKQKPVLPQREKSARQRRAPEKLDL